MIEHREDLLQIKYVPSYSRIDAYETYKDLSLSH